MGPLRGRPPKVHPSLIKIAIMKKKIELIENGKIKSKSDVIWEEISKGLEKKILPTTLYSMVVCNKYEMKTELLSLEKSDIVSNQFESSSEKMDVEEMRSESLNIDNNTDNSDEFVIPILRTDYEKLIKTQYYKRREMSRKKTYIRETTVLEPGLWQDLITRELWNSVKLKCGFQFSGLKLRKDASFGTVHGDCKCGSSIECEFNASPDTGSFIELKCRVSEGDGQSCGKRFLRKPIRQIVAKQLQYKSALCYRTEKANELQSEGDAEPPNLYSLRVLNSAKQEFHLAQFPDRNPILSLEIMKSFSLKNTIHAIGLDPFFVHYATNHQHHMYKEYTKKHAACITIDATGGIIRSMRKQDEKLSQHIFLYECVINYQGKQFSINQMLSESQDAGSIATWLLQWVRRGAIPPKEVVCDASKAILNAVSLVFAGSHTIQEYANAYSDTGPLPRCFIRLDNAHFIKLYSIFLKNVHRPVRVFLLSAIGRLIVTQDLEKAAQLLKSILIVTRSETDGLDSMNLKTPCTKHKEEIKKILNQNENTSYFEINIDDPEEEEETAMNESIFERSELLPSNSWLEWARGIDKEIRPLCVVKGNNFNALYMPRLADKIINDFRLYPVWSCIGVKRYGYGRVPATSSSVESDFNIVKNHLLKNCTLPMRADEFVKIHVDFLNGRLKIAEGQVIGNIQYNNNELVFEINLLVKRCFSKGFLDHI